MWVSKPIYEGVISLMASMYLNHWYWPTICFVVGMSTLVGGLVLFLKRRDFRYQDQRGGKPREE
jgi:hypothetical protein